MSAAAAATLAAAPALANSSAAAADMSAPVQDAQAGPMGGDAQFRELFASWRSLDGTGAQPVATTGISVPSRMPLEDSRLTSNYGMRNHPVLGGRRAHSGVDLAAPTGTPVYATADGIVGRANWFSSYGLFIQIEHGANLQTRYAHLSKLAVADGQRVRKGDLIGYVGSTGRSTGPHLHYEVRVNGKAVNPMPYMIESEAQQAFALATGEGGMGGGDE
ncbi:M23 family metallopeptidase [Pelagerythrobacter marensis]|uniref:M23 family metallopeptidase n=1 Tax=Pelagerythrobacter marensis TaxID=543877 RepID=A0ABZ2D796_9SPHN